jgi:hypothetical protein
MRVISRLLLGFAAAMFALADNASAQTARSILDYFRGTNTQPSPGKPKPSAWAKIPEKEIDCIDQELKKQGTSAKALRQRGVEPTDERVVKARSTCRTQSRDAAMPSGAPASAAAASATPATGEPPAAGTPSPYAVDGLALGARAPSEYAGYPAFRCGPSEQFGGLTWCQRFEREKRGQIDRSVVTSILHAQDGRAAYVNQTSEPAIFGASGFKADLDRLSARFGGPPRLLKIPDKDGLPDAVIATWGKIELEPLDAGSMATLAAGESPRKGLLVDFLANFQRSAKLGLPVYRLSGGAGYVWSASAHRNGRGHQRSLAFDADIVAPARVATAAPASSPMGEPVLPAGSPSAVNPDEEKAAIEKAAAEKSAADKAAAEKAALERFAAEKAAVEKAAAEKAALERVAAEKAAADKAAAEKAAAAKAAAEKVAAEKVAAEKAAAEQAASEKAAADKFAAETIAAQKQAAAKAATEKAALEKAAAERIAAAQAAVEKATAEKVAVEKAAAERVAAAKAAAEKAAAEKVAAEAAAAEKIVAAKAAAEKAATEKIAAARAAAEKAAAEKAAAEKAVAEKAAAEKIAAAKAAAEKAAAEKAVAEKAAAEKIAAAKAAAEKAAAEKAAAEKAAAEKIAAAEKAAAEKLAAEKAAAERAVAERGAATRLALATRATSGETAAERAAAAAPKAEEKVAKFRSVYIGMHADQFAAAIKELKLSIKMQLSTDQSGGGKEHHLLVEIMPKDGGKPVMYADVRNEAPIADNFAATYGLKVLDKAPDYTIYSGVNPPRLPKFTIRRLVFYPGFFDATGISADDFAQLLLEKYRFVGSKLHDGSKKDQCDQCMVGLLRSGESLVLRRDGNSDWSLEVEQASDEFSQLFRPPKL